ncbi:hypothetical protein NHG31_08305, partial [Aerococcaceae bacterium NML171108]|nr:hypothetical protein [Aerococcaceae bacterium NML171108]
MENENEKKKEKKSIIDKVLEFLCKNFNLVILIGGALLGFLLGSVYHKISYEWLKKILVNSDGSVNGTVLTAVVASLALIINTWYRQKEYKANLISKSRITWLNTAREISAEIASLSHDIIYRWEIVFEQWSTLDKNRLVYAHIENKPETLIDIYVGTKVEEINQKKNLLFKQILLFNMYFGSNEENDKLIDKINEIKENINEMISIFDECN